MAATDEDYRTEFLEHIIAVRGPRASPSPLAHTASSPIPHPPSTGLGLPRPQVKAVGSAAEAVQHINTHGSRHTDAVVTEDMDTVCSLPGLAWPGLC
jgi:gamma-glutamyl phosphate reductase